MTIEYLEKYTFHTKLILHKLIDIGIFWARIMLYTALLPFFFYRALGGLTILEEDLSIFSSKVGSKLNSDSFWVFDL